MLLVLFTLILAAIVWIVLKPSWLPKPPENKVTDRIMKGADKATQATKNASSTVAEKTGGWFNWVKKPFKKQASLGNQLKTWAAGLDADHQELSAWLKGLSDQAADQLANDLSAFCRSQNLELSWLFDEKTAPELKNSLEEVLLLQTQSIFKAGQAQPLIAFHQWQAAPSKPENRAFTQKLFVQLVSAGLTSVPGDLLLASDKVRESHVLKAIQSALSENRAAVLGLLNEVHAAKEPIVEIVESTEAAQPEPAKKSKKSPVVTVETASQA